MRSIAINRFNSTDLALNDRGTNRGTYEQSKSFITHPPLSVHLLCVYHSVFFSPLSLNLKVKWLLFSLKPLLFLLLSVYTGGANQFCCGQSARGPSGFMHTNPPILLNTHLPLSAHLYLPLIPFLHS